MWNARLPDDIRVRIDELVPGDLLIALSSESEQDKDSWFDPWNMERKFLGPGMNNETIRVEDSDDHKVYQASLKQKGQNVRHVWIRARAAQAMATGYKNDTRWNGKCKCGANTYSSCFSVEHEGECTL